MAERTLVERIEILERKAMKREDLPAEVAALRAGFVQFRAENAAEHSAMRVEFREALQVQFDDAKRHSLVLHEHLVHLIKTLKSG